MKWKLSPNEVLSYKTVMKEIDTANQKDFSMDGMMKAMGTDKLMDDKDKKAQSVEMQKMLKLLRAQAQHANYVTSLQEKRKNIINIEMKTNNTPDQKSVTDTDKSLKAMQALMNKMSSGAGSVYEDGTIESFYTKSDQKNLLAMMFELPGKPVKPGGTWPISIYLISMDQNFKCDSSYQKNSVIFNSIEYRNGDHIATLKYDIEEFVDGDFMSPFNSSDVKTSMKMTYQGGAAFSIEKGRWIMYEGVMSLSSTGIMSSQSTQKISLIID
jgi:hypothetical protein